MKRLPCKTFQNIPQFSGNCFILFVIASYYYKMKPHRKEKIDSTEFSRLREICYNYHKFLWTKFKRRIRVKRLNK